MRLGRRSAPTATYAALVGQHLWLVLDRPGVVSLRGVEVPVETELQRGHHGVRVDLGARDAPAAEQSHELLVDGRALVGPAVRAAPAGAVVALARDAAGHLIVVRRPVAAGARVRALRLVGETVEIDLDAPGHARLVDAAGRVVATLPTSAGTVTIGPDDLADAAPGDHTLLVDDQPARRRANTLPDPGAGALLPALHSDGAEHARARLRWSPDATLVVRVHG